MKARLALAALLAVTTVSAQQRAPQNDSIRSDDLRADLFFYASDAMRGRLLDTPENRIASEWIKQRFERLGLKPAAGNSFFQDFDVVSATLGSPNELEIASGTGMTRRPVAGDDFVTARFSGSARARGPVVFTGFGISSPDRKHDDYAGDVKGKIALVLLHEPGERDEKSPFDGLVTAEASVGWRKALVAQQKGAIGVLFVDDAHNHMREGNFAATARATWPENPGPRAKGWTLAGWLDELTIPAIQISRTLGEGLVRPTGKSLEELSRAAERAGPPLAIPGVEVTMTTTVNRPVTTLRNVAALVEGSDAQLKNEAVIVVAHLDHEGVDGGQIYTGADDNGSGTVGLLEVAEAYALAARDGQRPRRSVLFLSVNAEERGLLGAWAYTERPLMPLDRTAGVLNMDMIGRNEEIPPNGGGRFFGLQVTTAEANANSIDLYGYSYAPALAAAIERANAAYGLTLKKRNDNNASNLVRRSDHWPFLHRGVPAIGFHSGLHPDYHTPADRPDKINYAKMETIVRLVHATSWALANDSARSRVTTSR
jgi:hypothetical protein